MIVMKWWLVIISILNVSFIHSMQHPLAKQQATKNLIDVIQQAIDAVDSTSIRAVYRNNFNPLPKIEEYIKARADLNAIDAKGNTPLANAVWLQDVRMELILLMH